jgi:hypothetical protein
MARETITIGANDYGSNVTLAVATAYLTIDPVFGASWLALATDDLRNGYLIAATRRLDLLTWDLDLDTETIPTVVQNATALMAAEIMLKPAYAQAGTSENLVKRIKAGSAEKENFRPEDSTVPLQSKTVYSMVLPYLSAGQDLSVPTGSSGSCTSQFGDANQGYGHIRGYS